ncbi:MAG: SH3 domain-containing protein [Anaerolineae bacterium]
MGQALVAWFGLTALSGSGGIAATPTLVAAAILPEPTETEVAEVVVEPTAVPTQKPTNTAVAIVATEPPTVTPNPTATQTPTPRPTSTPLPLPPPIAQVAVSRVNVRYGPDTAYGLVTNLAEAGAQFEVIGRNEAGDWWQLCCVDDQVVWIASDPLELTGDIDSIPVVENPLSHAVVQVERLNLRRSPDLDSEVLQVIVRRDRIDVTGRLFDDSWWQVCCVNGESGWVYGESVTIEGLLDEIPIVNKP